MHAVCDSVSVYKPNLPFGRVHCMQTHKNKKPNREWRWDQMTVTLGTTQGWIQREIERERLID